MSKSTEKLAKILLRVSMISAFATSSYSPRNAEMSKTEILSSVTYALVYK